MNYDNRLTAVKLKRTNIKDKLKTTKFIYYFGWIILIILLWRVL